jgi:tetratricopeptide (TPR) repeat protein
MRDLWLALGYERVADNVAAVLADDSRMTLIEGPPGVGKSWLAKGVGAAWEGGGGRTVVAVGDNGRADFDLYPFGLAMAGLSGGWKSLAPSVAGAAKAAEAVLGTAGLITTALQGVATMRRGRRSRRAVFLGDEEQEILFEIERLAVSKPVLLIADNLHWWDKRSLALLRDLQSIPMQESFPFLASLRVLAVETPPPYQTVARPEAHGILLEATIPHRFLLERVPREGFENVLLALGAGHRPTPKVADVVHSFTGGHLALASRAATRLANGDGELMLSVARSDEFWDLLVSARLSALGDLGKRAVKLLQVAALLGLTFSRDEIVCATDDEADETSLLLRYCRDEQLLDVSGGTCWFVHDVYRQHFLESGPTDRVATHGRLGECLRLLRPAEYDLRSSNAERAELPEAAAALAVQGALQRLRNGRRWHEGPADVISSIVEGGLVGVVELFVEAGSLLGNYQYIDCLAILERLPRDLSTPLSAEADYIRAMCRLSARNGPDRAQGRTILEAWEGYADTEPELGIRLERLLLYGLSHVLDKQAGRELEGLIRRRLVDRAAFDPSAIDELYNLDRCSGSLYQPDISVIRNSEAAAHFGPRAGSTLVRRPVDYYRSLVNLGAGLICNGRYDEAVATYSSVEELVDEYVPGIFPRLDHARSNALLAEFRLGGVSADAAVQRQRRINETLGVDGDPYYIRNALAVYLAFAGEHDESLQMLEALIEDLTVRYTDPEPSMLYVLRANRNCVGYVAGRPPLLGEWEMLAEVLQRVPYSFQSLLVRRHELLSELFESGVSLSAREFDRYLPRSGRPEFGPLWDNFGRGFRMPEIEFWREN